MAHHHTPTVVDVITVMQQSIESIKGTQLHKVECEAIAQRLKPLKDKLNDSHEQLRRALGTGTFEKIVQRLFKTVTTFMSLIQQCQNPNPHLQGSMKLRVEQTLKSELDSIRFSLIKYEADLTADLQKKKEILSAGLREKQETDKNRQEVQIKERAQLVLRLAEAEATMLAQEKLPELYTKHSEILDRYLLQCKSAHIGIQIAGLETTINDFSCNIYPSCSVEPTPEILDKIRTIELPVQSVYIHLQADQATAFERKQARKLILKDEEDEERDKVGYDRELWMGLAAAPFMDSDIYRERVHKKKESKKSSFRDMLSNNRWIVVLGDPGSGKTTFVRWLVSIYIQAISQNTPVVSSDDNPQDAENDNVDSVAGPTRMPILIRVGEFVEACSKNRSLTLKDYIGYHTWLGNYMLDFPTRSTQEERDNDMKQLQTALHEYITEGYALIVLDGLDEIPESETRTRIVRLVEEFAGEHVLTPKHVSVFDDKFVGGELDIPSQTGGNQLIITSRIAGYKAKPLNGHFSHYTILPMEMDDIKKFIDHWFQTVHKKLIEALKLNITDEMMEAVCQTQTQLLKTALEKPNNKGLRQMASNPCLMNFICLIAFRTRGAELPAQRICLYDEMAKLMMKLWVSKIPHGLATNQNRADRLLCDIATYIHHNRSSGLIETTTLKMVCSKALQPFNESKIKEDLEKQANQCIEQFQKSTGIFAELGQHLYGFLHLTLQEYYTCKAIVSIEKNINRPKQLVKIVEDRITDPRFRIPLILALGWVSWKWEQIELEEFCQKLFTLKNHLSQYFPLETLMFITRMEEFKKLPGEKIIFTALNRLLAVAGQNDWHSNYPDLEKQIATGLYKMSKQLIEAWILDIVSSDKLPIESVAALCKLLQQCERIAESEENGEKKKFLKTWINRDICTWLFKYFPNDTIENQFLVDAVLAKVAIQNSKVLPANDLRTLFTENESCLIHLNLPVLAAIIALCGGLTLSNIENKKRRSGSQDYDGDMVTSARFAVVFSPQHMHRKSPLISELKKYIQATQNATGFDVISDFVRQIQKKAEKIQLDDQTLEAVDTFILMFCIVGVDEFWLYRPFVHHKAFQLAINRFKRILNYLRQLYFIPEIYDRHDRSITSKESLLSNFDNFNRAHSAIMLLLAE